MRFASEESECSINCHPELAKDLTTHQAALCHRSTFSKLTALLAMPSVPKTLEVKITVGRPREIPSTDSGQALRKLPMNLPERRGVRERESGEHTRPRVLASAPSPTRTFLRCRRDQPRRCLWRGRQRPHARARVLPGSWRDAGSCSTITLALWRG